jgi:murein DD-endopeptidase MepM/ murein hydrolase activator NlpD
MNEYRHSDPTKRKQILKPLSSSKKPASRPPREIRTEESGEPLSRISRPKSEATQTRPGADPGSAAALSGTLESTRGSFVSRIPRPQTAAIFNRSVSVPIWLVAILVLVLVTTPTLGVLYLGGHSSSDPAEPESTAAEVVEVEVTPTPEIQEESDDEIPLALEVDEIFDATQWDEPEPPAVSQREQYMLDQGVNPNTEFRYAADEVERLQSEIEAIQRNSAMLRSLARQQSGDLSEAYSSLEASQDHADGAIEDLQQRLDELEGRISSVDELARELRDLLGMPPSESGMGGPLPSMANDGSEDPWLNLRADIVSIEHWAGELVFDLDEVNTEIQLRIAQMEQANVERAASVSEEIEYYDSMPMGWPVDGPITSRFGVRSSPFAGEGGASEMHTGIDIAARTGTPVVATGGGTVQVSGDNGGYGLLVVIDHGRGVTSWYGHNSRLLVSPGDRVNAGDVIAEVGSTGRSTGPHVHYEVRVNGAPEDPLPYMQMNR